MKKVIILRYSEIWLKGKNKGFFERAFETNLARAVSQFSCQLVKQSGRYLIKDFYEDEAEAIIEKLKKVNHLGQWCGVPKVPGDTES